MSAALGLIELEEIKFLYKIRAWSDLLTVLLTIVLTVIFGLEVSTFVVLSL